MTSQHRELREENRLLKQPHLDLRYTIYGSEINENLEKKTTNNELSDETWC